MLRGWCDQALSPEVCPAALKTLLWHRQNRASALLLPPKELSDKVHVMDMAASLLPSQSGRCSSAETEVPLHPVMPVHACLQGCSARPAHLLHICSCSASLPEVHAALLHAQHAQGALPVGRRLAEVDLGRLGQLAGEDAGLLQGSTLGPSALQDDAQVYPAQLQRLSRCCLRGLAALGGVEASMQAAPGLLKTALQTAAGQAQTVCSLTFEPLQSDGQPPPAGGPCVHP